MFKGPATAVELDETQQASASATVLSELLPALRRLDTLLEHAVSAMQAQIGASAANSFRGLFISREQVDRLLQQDPGSPCSGSSTHFPQKTPIPRRALLRSVG